MRQFTLLLITSLLSVTALAQRQVYDLNNHWTFSPGWDAGTPIGTPVTLPHTWNSDTHSPDYYRGMGNYVRIFDAPTSWRGKEIYIRFKGATTTCDLFINGRYVGQHRGGYTAFGWNITRFLNSGERNTIMARVSNAQDMNTLPIAADFNIYGGLTREVDLIVVPATHIAPHSHGSQGLYITPTSVTDESASVNVNIAIEGAPDQLVETTFRLLDNEMKPLDSVVRTIKIDDRGINRLAASFTVQNPHLWNGTKDPYLYHMEVTIRHNNTYDRVSQHFGLRYFEVDARNRFLLNGKPYPIKGVCRVEDWASRGTALYRDNHRRDIEWIKEMGANAVRLAYYPNDPYFISLCDKAGILVWSEIPLVKSEQGRGRGYNESEPLKQNAREQLSEMIHQLYNHPSIVWWGLFDQLWERGDNPVEFVRELNRMAKEQDASRLTVAGSNQDGDLNFITDLIGFNQFMGWGSGMPADFDGWTRDLRQEFPRLPSGVGKYGAGGNIYQHSDSLARPVIESGWHPENWQRYLHETYWKSISEHPRVWGTFVWTMFDYGQANAPGNSTPGVSDFGLITYDRGTAKDAFYFYKANWNDDDGFIHICGKREDRRTTRPQQITVYSNQAEVELLIDGVSKGKMKNDGLGRFTWRGIELSPGTHEILAVEPYRGIWDKFTVVTTEVNPLPPARQPAGGNRQSPARGSFTGR